MPIDTDAELARCRSDRHFVGWAMAVHRTDQKMTLARQAGWLGMERDALAKLEMRMRPRPAAFERDMNRLAREHPCNRDRLAAVCRLASTLEGAEGGPGSTALTVAEIADELGVTPRRIYQLRGVRRRKPRLTDVDRERVRGLLAAGKSRREAAKLTGRARHVVDEIAWAAGNALA